MNVNSVTTMGYKNIRSFSRRENKPNSNPISKQNKANQTQSKPKEQPKNPEFPTIFNFYNPKFSLSDFFCRIQLDCLSESD